MRTFRSLILIAAALVAAPLTAKAQQYSIVSNCSLGVDGGTTSSTLTCPSVSTNFQPTILQCEITTAGSHLAGSTTLQGCADVTHCGPIEDGGVTLYFNQDVNTVTTLSAPLLAGAGAGVNNPYQTVEPVTSITSNDGGTAGGGIVNCQTVVGPAQTLHAVHPNKK